MFSSSFGDELSKKYDTMLLPIWPRYPLLGQPNTGMILTEIEEEKNTVESLIMSCVVNPTASVVKYKQVK